MGFLSNFLGKRPGEVFSAASPFFMSGFGDHGSLNCRTERGQAHAYELCPAVRSVVNKKLLAIQNAKVWAVDEQGEQVNKPALVTEMANPNPYQQLMAFVAQTEAYINIFGRAFWYVAQGVGVAAREIYVIPNLLITPHYKYAGTLADMIRPESDVVKYTICINGGSFTLQPDEVQVVYDISAPHSVLFGSISRLTSLEEQINSFQFAGQGTTELMNNRGMLGIISLYDDKAVAGAVGAANIPAIKSEKDTVQEAMRKYGSLRKQFKYVITSLAAKFTPVSSTIADLGANDAQREAKRIIADVFGVPPSLVDVPDSKYSNLEQSKVIMYTDAIIPEANAIFTALNKIYGNAPGAQVMPFYDHLELFQAAKRAAAAGYTSLVNALNQAVAGNLMSTEEARAELLKYMT